MLFTISNGNEARDLVLPPLTNITCSYISELYCHLSKKSQGANLANRAHFKKVMESPVHKSQSKASFNQSLHKVMLLIM
jgi:hypothetical protein